MHSDIARSRRLARRGPNQFRPEVLGLEQRMMLSHGHAAAAVASAPVITALSNNSRSGHVLARAAKQVSAAERVPGCLKGDKYNDLATPYDSPVIPGLRIDNQTVNYWRITLNEGDSVLLTLAPDSLPSGGTSPANFVIRIWGPDNKEILPANKQPVMGTNFTFVAPAKGICTYTIGISTGENATYKFDPDTPATPPLNTSPSLHIFTATFNVYPGPKTSLMDILQHYSGDWPKWTPDQLAAYNTLTTIARRANDKAGTGIIDFSGSFEQVGKATTAKISNWLTSTWAPFQEILETTDRDQEKLKAANIYNDHAFPVINAAYPTLAEWLKVATPFINNQDLQTAYTHVHGVLSTANADRVNLDTFLKSLNAWSAAYQQLVGNEPSEIAADLTDGLTKVPEMQKPVQQFSWLKTLIGSFITVFSSAVSIITETPTNGLITSFLLNAIANPLDAYLDGYFDKKPPAPDATNTSVGLPEAAEQMEHFSNEAFYEAFTQLASPSFEASLFSNYGLLTATEHVLFSPSAFDTPNLAPALVQNYDTSVWQKLLPRMFSWRMVPYTDNGPANTLRNFTFFIPVKEHFDNGYTEGNLGQSSGEMISQAREELLQLQGGNYFDFGGHDFTPLHSTDPGPISVAQRITGNSGSLYTITPDSHIVGTLYKRVYGIYKNVYITLDGDTIHEWALETSNGQRISQAATSDLFGTGPLELATPVPVYYSEKDKPSYTYALKLQSGGLATRLDVFKNWGAGVKGFSPGTFQPPKPPDESFDMSVDDDPKGKYDVYGNMYVNYKMTYGSK
jgi:hypothetical protein